MDYAARFLVQPVDLLFRSQLHGALKVRDRALTVSLPQGRFARGGESALIEGAFRLFQRLAPGPATR